jgi:hypothetical protein
VRVVIETAFADCVALLVQSLFTEIEGALPRRSLAFSNRAPMITAFLWKEYATSRRHV